MPTLGQVIQTAAPAAGNVADYLLRRRGLNSATATVTAGANAAGQRIDTATQDAINRQDRTLGQQQGLYDDSIARQQPAAGVGLDALTRYQDLLDNPTQFDPATVMQEPGYQFGLDQTTKAVDRAGKGVFNRAQLDAKTKNVLDYATTRYNDAFQRFMQTQQRQDGLIKGGVDIGTNANASMDAAGKTFGDQLGANADKTGTLGVNAAEDRAGLDIVTAENVATNQALGANNAGNTLGKLAESIPGILGLFGKGGAEAGTGKALTLGSVSKGLGTAGKAIGGGIGKLSGLAASNPFAAAAIGAGIAGSLLAKHYIGQGRKAADKLTGEGGLAHEFENVLGEIDRDSGLASASDKWAAKTREYQSLEAMAIEYAKKGKNERKVASQMLDTIAPLFGATNPLRAA